MTSEVSSDTGYVQAGTNGAMQLDDVKEDHQQTLMDKTEEPPQSLCNCCAMWRWFKAKPLERWPFAVYVLMAAATIVWIIIYFSSTSLGYVLTGVIVILSILSMLNHFKVLLGLKKEVDKYELLNKDFKVENAELTMEIDKLSKSKIQLEDTSGRLKEANIEIAENLKAFEQLNRNLQSTTSGNVSDLIEVQSRSEQMLKQWKRNQIQKEKSILNTVYERVVDECVDHSEEELDEKEFTKFTKMLPTKYENKIKQRRNSFANNSGKDAKLDFEEFKKWMDHLVEDCGHESHEDEDGTDNLDDHKDES